MKISRITVRAGRCIPHPLHAYGNLKGDLEIVADLDDGEDADDVRKQLHSKIESDIEQHMADLKDGIRGIQDQLQTRRRIQLLESELAKKTEELDKLNAEWDDRPLLRPAQ